MSFLSDRVIGYWPRPPRAQSYGDTWDDYREEDYPDCHQNNGIFALQEKINLLKNHPSEIFNFMVVSGSPRLGKSFSFILNYTSHEKLQTIICNTAPDCFETPNNIDKLCKCFIRNITMSWKDDVKFGKLWIMQIFVDKNYYARK